MPVGEVKSYPFYSDRFGEVNIRARAPSGSLEKLSRTNDFKNDGVAQHLADEARNTNTISIKAAMHYQLGGSTFRIEAVNPRKDRDMQRNIISARFILKKEVDEAITRAIASKVFTPANLQLSTRVAPATLPTPTRAITESLTDEERDLLELVEILSTWELEREPMPIGGDPWDYGCC